jgi:hypothetical protein
LGVGLTTPPRKKYVVTRSKEVKTRPICQQDETRRDGRPKIRWEDGVDQDMTTLGVKNWRRVTLDREEWAKLLKKARAHQGLSSH